MENKIAFQPRTSGTPETVAVDALCDRTETIGEPRQAIQPLVDEVREMCRKRLRMAAEVMELEKAIRNHPAVGMIVMDHNQQRGDPRLHGHQLFFPDPIPVLDLEDCDDDEAND